MLTKSQFEKRWKKMIPQQKKFVLKYIECFDAKQAAIEAGYTGVSIKHPIYRVLRKVSDVTDYLIAKQNLYCQLVKKEWVVNQIKLVIENTQSNKIKLEALDKLSKILQLQNDSMNLNINNNIPQVPVQITFNQQENKQ